MSGDDKQPQKRGPKEDRLNIETDPDDALDKLLGGATFSRELAMARVTDLTGESGIAEVDGRRLCPDHVIEEFGEGSLTLVRVGTVESGALPVHCSVCKRTGTHITVLTSSALT